MQKSYIDKLGLVLVQNKKLLVARSKGKDVWFMPGGKREKGETDQDALTREVKEELSVDVVPKTIQYYGTFEAQAHGKPEGIFVKITCYTADYSGQLKPSAEIEELAWFGVEDKEKTTVTGKLILNDLLKKGFIR